MATTSIVPGGGATALILPSSLSAENRNKLTALGNAWLLAKMELAKPAPEPDLKWVQTVADGSTTTLPLATVTSEYGNAPDTRRRNEIVALEAFAAGALALIKSISAEAPAEAQALITGWLRKLEYFKDDASAKATNLQKGVDELNEVLKEITPGGSGHTTSAA